MENTELAETCSFLKLSQVQQRSLTPRGTTDMWARTLSLG